MTTDLNKSCAEANSRTTEWINRSAGQHRRAMKAQIVQTHAEAEYAKPLHGYTDLDQRNSDGSSPHGDPLEWVDQFFIRVRWVALAAAVVCGILAFATFGGKS
jgi:hypothetical protein